MPKAVCLHYYWYAFTFCFDIPSASTPSFTISPGLRYPGGLSPIPTPDGVPVEIISPGNKHVK